MRTESHPQKVPRISAVRSFLDRTGLAPNSNNPNAIRNRWSVIIGIGTIGVVGYVGVHLNDSLSFGDPVGCVTTTVGGATAEHDSLYYTAARAIDELEVEGGHEVDPDVYVLRGDILDEIASVGVEYQSGGLAVEVCVDKDGTTDILLPQHYNPSP